MKRTAIYMVLLLATGLAAGCAFGAQNPAPATAAPSPAAKTDLFGDVLVAKGKNIAVKRSELDEAMVNFKSSVAARGQAIPPDRLDSVEQGILERLIQIQLLMAKANDADKAAGKEITSKRFEAIKERAKDEESLSRQLKAMGTSPEKLRAQMTEEATAEYVLERELKVNVTDEQIKNYYDENPAKFEQPEMVRASHILFSTVDSATRQELPEDKKAAKRKLAEDVLKRARSGEDFAKLASQYSEDPGSKDNGGEYTFPRGQMVPEFEKAAFAMKPNEVSDIVTTQFGYHIIKLSEKIPAKKLEFAKVSMDIREYLKQEEVKKRQQEYQDLVEKMKKDAGVTILDDRLKPKENPQTGAAPRPAPPAPASK